MRHSVRNRSVYRQRFVARRNSLRKKHEDLRRHCGNQKSSPNLKLSRKLK